MSTKIETNFDFKQNEAINFVHQRLSSAPATPVEGQKYYNTTTKKLYCWNGTKWVEGTEIATDEQIAAGTSTDVAVNPKQLKTEIDKKQNVLEFVPESTENKVISLSASSTTEQYPSAKTVYDSLKSKADVASPEFTGIPKAPTPTSGDSSKQLANTEFVSNAINNAISGATVYLGSWDTTNATDYSSLNSFRPIKKGGYFRVAGSGTTIDGVEYRAGDSIVFNRDVATSTSIITAMIDHYDHTQREDSVYLDEAQTLKNKTINADNNTISNLEVDNFKSGIVKTSMSASPSDSNLLTEKAIDTELDKKAPLASPTFTGTVTVPTAADGDNSTKAASTAFVQKAVSSATGGALKKEVYKNPILTPVDGKCTWTINHTLATTDVICNITEVSTGDVVIMDQQATSSTVFTIKLNAAASVSANTYKAILIGV